jgi:hypothetical protein
MRDTSFPIRLSLLAAVALTLVTIGFKVLSLGHLFAPGGLTVLIAEVVLLLLLYGVVIAWPARSRGVLLRSEFATAWGAVGGVLQVIHLLVERFSSFRRPWDGVITLAFMLATFLLWSYVGYRARSQGLSFGSSCGVAMWSAVVTMTIAVMAGTLLEFVMAPYPLEAVSEWAEFKRSGWTDVRAFSIANTLDAASSHLLIGPIVACVFGGLGCALWSLLHPSARRALSD